MSKTLDEFLAKIDAGWHPPPIEKAEYLRRVRLQIQAVLGQILDASPSIESSIVKHMQAADSLEELGPMIARLGEAAEEKHPGIVRMADYLIKKEAALSRELVEA